MKCFPIWNRSLLVLVIVSSWRFLPGTSGTTARIEKELEESQDDMNSVKCDPNPDVAPVISPEDLVHYYLNTIQELSTGPLGICSPEKPQYIVFPGINISIFDFKLPKEKADLIISYIPKIVVTRDTAQLEVQNGLELLGEEPTVNGLRYVRPIPSISRFSVYDKALDNPLTLRTVEKNERQLLTNPWYFNPQAILKQPRNIDTQKFDTVHNVEPKSTRLFNPNVVGFWTWPYFKCAEVNDSGHGSPRKWLISYTTAFRTETSSGLLSFDVDLTPFKINQCEAEATDKAAVEKHRPMSHFHGTHKCDPETTKCRFLDKDAEPIGWLKGNYECVCKSLHHAFYTKWNNTIPGFYLETKSCAEKFGRNETEESISEKIASCNACPEGCPDCLDGSSCMAQANYIFRMTLLCISVLCSMAALGLIFGVYSYRKHQIFSASSPIFLCICLFGCFVMYLEMVVLFPTLSREMCIAVKWTRHLGFCITYTALYMKLCRVYLTFRVKSAHKIKLTEKHLLHWMSPIMVIMLLYLMAWTISAPINFEVLKTHDGKRLHQCIYNWWDHVLSVGEIIFLAYGVFICWRIRENHDAQFISYSIYNIALVNVIMVTLHLIVMPKAGPDMKYLLAFVRVQLSTTITIALVLGSKVYRAYRGDYPTMKEIANSANGFGGDILDLGEENEQLKEELQKMAYQMEKLKSYAMTKNNRHISNTSGPIPDKLDNLTSL